MQVEILPITRLSEEIESRWLNRWKCWPTAHFFNHPKWSQIVHQALPARTILIILGRADGREIVFMTVEGRGTGLQFAGTPFLDKGAILWDPELSPEAWRQFVAILLNRFEWIRFQELSSEGPWQSEEEPLDSQSMRRHSSDSPYFDVTSPRLSSKQRHELRRYTNVLRRQGTLEISFRRSSVDDLKTMAAIERQSSKVDRRIGVLSDVEYVRWLEAIVGTLTTDCWIALMTLNRQPIAHYMAILCKETLLGIHMAFVKQYSSMSPGNVLIYNILPQLIENGIKRFDYGRGQSTAKAKFAGDASLKQYDLYYFRASWGGLRAQAEAQIFWRLVAMRRVIRTHAGRWVNSALDRLSIRR